MSLCWHVVTSNGIKIVVVCVCVCISQNAARQTMYKEWKTEWGLGKTNICRSGVKSSLCTLAQLDTPKWLLTFLSYIVPLTQTLYSLHFLKL